jgi:phage-related baseplate assembly protein
VSAVFTAIDLSKLPPPQVVELLDYEAIFQEMLANLRQLDPAFDALVESDPAYSVLQVAAYREMILRQKMNDKAKARMLAFATEADLDHIGASMAVPVVRLAGEEDEAYRRRLALAPEAYSTAGSIGGYTFHALSAHSSIKDIAVWNPDIGGRVNVAVLSKNGNGACYGARVNNPAGYEPGAAAITVKDVLSDLPNGLQMQFEGGAVFTLDNDFEAGAAELTGALAGSLVDGERFGILPFVTDALNPDSVRPICDKVAVMSAEILEYEIAAGLVIFYGPDAQTVLANARKSVAAYAAKCHACGRDVTMSGLLGSLHVEGVKEVVLTSPIERMEVSQGQAAFCTSIIVTITGRDE